MAMKEEFSYPISPPTDSEFISVHSKLTTDEGKMADETTPSTPDTSNRVPSAIRRSQSPPRNDQGEIVCDHPNCRGKTEVFRRLCEWNKHMDRHERPYKCHESGCELSPGFTYSGGLLRHQREVHKMHLSTKQPLYCPVHNCNRSSGAGFTRKENLEEHKRRRHVGEVVTAQGEGRLLPSPSLSAPTVVSQNIEPSRKRRRLLQQQNQQQPQFRDEHNTEAFGEDVLQRPSKIPATNTADEDEQDENPMITQLRFELAQKDEYIRRQAAEIQRLQNIFRSLPPQAIYGVLSPNLPGAHMAQ